MQSLSRCSFSLCDVAVMTWSCFKECPSDMTELGALHFIKHQKGIVPDIYYDCEKTAVKWVEVDMPMESPTHHLKEKYPKWRF